MIEVVTEEMHGSTQHTIFVNPNLLTAAIPPGEVATPGPDSVTVVDTGGTSKCAELRRALRHSTPRWLIAADSCPGWSLLLRLMV